MSEKANYAKIIDALKLAKQARVGCELTYFEVIELLGNINSMTEHVRELAKELRDETNRANHYGRLWDELRKLVANDPR